MAFFFNRLEEYYADACLILENQETYQKLRVMRQYDYIISLVMKI